MNILDVFTYNQHFVAMMNIINAARLNPPIKGHKHHIVPRCWFKLKDLQVDNSDSNLVLLTYEDHCKVHKLMTLCAIDDEMTKRFKFAYQRVTNGSVLGLKHTDTTKQLMSLRARQRNPECYKGRTISEEHKKKLSEAHKGKAPWNKGLHYKMTNSGRTGKPHPHKGRTGWHWKLVNGKRVWYEQD